LAYYTKFSRVSDSENVANKLYTWNSRQKDSLEAFSEGTVGMMFSYYSRYDDIKSKNPKLNFGVAPVPQFDSNKPITLANYWGYAVSKNKIASTQTVGQQPSAPVTNGIRTHEAWQFLRFLTLKNTGKVKLYNAITRNSGEFAINFDPALEYLKKTNLPAARRDLIELQKMDPVLSVFSQGNLIAKNWYQKDPDSVVKIMKTTIEAVNRGELTLHEALVLAKNRINAL
ncbi:MAG TPA: extracellular solute-binding protein, partial [Candidatus Moranbacteria bacterium]|nr:extracellular solute-binding protein [Candidatus Moranbacteria bacterium]